MSDPPPSHRKTSAEREATGSFIMQLLSAHPTKMFSRSKLLSELVKNHPPGVGEWDVNSRKDGNMLQRIISMLMQNKERIITTKGSRHLLYGYSPSGN